MLANKSSSPLGQNAVSEIAIDLPLKVPNNPFVPASEDPGITGVATRDAVIDRDTGVAARLFLPIPAVATAGRRLPLVVFFHGGGEMSAFSLTYHRYATALAARAGALVVSVEYRRVTPEHAGGDDDDAWAVLRWAASSSADPWLMYHADRRRTFLAGDGAGAGVAYRAAVRARRVGEDVHVEGVLLVDPYSRGRGWMASEKAGRGWFFSPAEDTPLLCRRALVVVVAGMGAAVRERGRRVAASMRGGCWWGGEVTVVELHGEDHGFHLYGPASGGSERLMESIVEFVNRKDGLCNKAVSAEEAPWRSVTKSCL
ncbi:unnamed protein product [Urochloa humidicola]